MSEGRDALGRFATGYAPDRGRGRPSGRLPLKLDIDTHRIVMATANLPVSIPRGRGRRVVTLYEAQIRRLASGRVYRRAAVMDFIRLVHEAAACTPEPVIRVPLDPAARAGLERLETELLRLSEASASPDTTDLERRTIVYYGLLIAMTRRNARY